jgi:hypothetical protein
VAVEYDAVLGPSSTQADAFGLIGDYVDKALDGYNCTVLAYGQTGTGKTYTMSGGQWTTDTPIAVAEAQPDAQNIERAQKGVIPRAFDRLFARISEFSSATTIFTVKTSCLEVYNEKIFDLLATKRSSAKSGGTIAGQRRDSSSTLNKELMALPLKETVRKEVFVDGLRKMEVASMVEMERLLQQASAQRAIRDTMYNEHSSRSHTIFQVHISKQELNGKNVVTSSSKLNFVDLAGSEKWKTTNGVGGEQGKMSGMHLKEMTAINKSLSALGSCINALAEEGRAHIPYRDSKLTRLLQDSLGGNSHVAFVVTVCGTEGRMTETHSSLKFADRARCVVTMPTVHRMVADEPGGVQAAKYYEKQISSLRSNLRRMRQQLEAAQKQRRQSEQAKTQAEAEVRAQVEAASRKASESSRRGSEQAAAAAEAEARARAAENAQLLQTLADTKKALGEEQERGALLRRERDEARCAEEAAKVVVGEAAVEEVRRERARERLLGRARAEGVTGGPAGVGVKGGITCSSHDAGRGEDTRIPDVELSMPGVSEFLNRGEGGSAIILEEPSKLFASAINKNEANSMAFSQSEEPIQNDDCTPREGQDGQEGLSADASEFEMRQLMDELEAEERRLESILEEEAKIQTALAQRQVELEATVKRQEEQAQWQQQLEDGDDDTDDDDEGRWQQEVQEVQEREALERQQAAKRDRQRGPGAANVAGEGMGGEGNKNHGSYNFDPAYQPTTTTEPAGNIERGRNSRERAGLSDQDGRVYRECGRGARVVQVPKSIRSDPQRHSSQEAGANFFGPGPKGGAKKGKKGTRGKKTGVGNGKRAKKQTWEEKLAEEGRRQQEQHPSSAPPPNYRPPLQRQKGGARGRDNRTTGRASSDPLVLPRMGLSDFSATSAAAGPSEFELRGPVSESDLLYEERVPTEPSPHYAHSEGGGAVKGGQIPVPVPPPGKPNHRQSHGYKEGRGPRRQRARSRERSGGRAREQDTTQPRRQPRRQPQQQHPPQRRHQRGQQAQRTAPTRAPPPTDDGEEDYLSDVDLHGGYVGGCSDGGGGVDGGVDVTMTTPAMQAQEMISIKAALKAEMDELQREYAPSARAGNVPRLPPAGVARLLRKLQARLAMVDAQLKAGQVGRAVGAGARTGASTSRYADEDENIDSSNIDESFNVQIVGGKVSAARGTRAGKINHGGDRQNENKQRKQQLQQQGGQQYQQEEQYEQEVLEEAEVEAVVGHRFKPRSESSGAGPLSECQYRVRWRGAGAEEDEWVERDELAEAEDPSPALLEEYERSEGIGMFKGRPYIDHAREDSKLSRPKHGVDRPNHHRPRLSNGSRERATAAGDTATAAATSRKHSPTKARRDAANCNSKAGERARARSQERKDQPEERRHSSGGVGRNREDNWAVQQQIYTAKGAGRRTGPAADIVLAEPALNISLAASFRGDTSEGEAVFAPHRGKQAHKQQLRQQQQQPESTQEQDEEDARYERVRMDMEARIAQL